MRKYEQPKFDLIELDKIGTFILGSNENNDIDFGAGGLWGGQQ